MNNVEVGRIYRSSTDIKFSPFIVTKVNKTTVNYYLLRDPDKLHTANQLEIQFWSLIQ